MLPSVSIATLARYPAIGHIFARGMPDRTCLVSPACDPRRDGAARGLRASWAFWGRKTVVLQRPRSRYLNPSATGPGRPLIDESLRESKRREVLLISRRIPNLMRYPPYLLRAIYLHTNVTRDPSPLQERRRHCRRWLVKCVRFLPIARRYPFAALSRRSASTQPEPAACARVARQQSRRCHLGFSCARPRDRSRHNRWSRPDRACHCAERGRQGWRQGDQSYALPHHERRPDGARRVAGSAHPSSALRCRFRASVPNSDACFRCSRPLAAMA
jgi:hypothetical protein